MIDQELELLKQNRSTRSMSNPSILHVIAALDWSQPAPTGLEHLEAMEAGRSWNDFVRGRLGPPKKTRKKILDCIQKRMNL